MTIKRIGILYTHDTQQIRGGERSILSLFESLNRYKLQPHLLVPEKSDFGQKAIDREVNVIYRKIPGFTIRNIWKIIKTILYLRRFISKNNIQIIHSFEHNKNILITVLAKMLKVPVIWHERNFPKNKNKDISKKYFFLPTRVICSSKSLAQRFSKRGKIAKKIRVVLDGVNLIAYGLPQNIIRVQNAKGQKPSKIIGLISNINAGYQVEFFIEMASRIQKQLNDVMFIIVGAEFPDRQGSRFFELREMCRFLGLQDHVRFEGFQNNIKQYLATFDLYCHVVVEKAVSQTIIEAMALHKPVIAINTPGNAEIIADKKTGLLIEPDNMTNFVDGALSLLKNNDKRRNMGIQARRRAEEIFDIKKKAEEIEQIYTDLL